MSKKRGRRSPIRRFVHRLLVVVGAGGLTLAFFLVLPLMQAISKPPNTDLLVRSLDTAPPPPSKTIEEPEPEKPPETKEPPKLEAEQSKPLSLGEMDLLANAGLGGGLGGGSISININKVASSVGGGIEEIARVADLDQKPRVTYQPSPVLDSRLRRKTPASVYVVFIVDERGRVTNPVVQRSSDPAFESPALAAVKQWRFDPGKRGGDSIRFRMRVPITFPRN